MAVDVDQGGIEAVSSTGSSHVSVGGAAILSHQDLDGNPLAGTQKGGLVLLDLLALGLVAAVLEPDLHLGLRQAQALGHLAAFRTGQVALLGKAALQLEDLGVAEGGTRPLLAAQSTAVVG